MRIRKEILGFKMGLSYMVTGESIRCSLDILHLRGVGHLKAKL